MAPLPVLLCNIEANDTIKCDKIRLSLRLSEDFWHFQVLEGWELKEKCWNFCEFRKWVILYVILGDKNDGDFVSVEGKMMGVCGCREWVIFYVILGDKNDGKLREK